MFSDNTKIYLELTQNRPTYTMHTIMFLHRDVSHYNDSLQP